MTHEELQQKVTTLNAKSSSLNQQRLQNIGRKETLQKQLSSALQQYNEKYSTNLTEEGVDAELSKVASDLESQVANVEAVISSIESGNYADAERLVKNVGGNGAVVEGTESVPKVEVNVPQVDASVPQNVPQATEVLTPPVAPPPVSSPIGQVAPPSPSTDSSFLGGVTQAPETDSVFNHDFKQQVEEETPSTPVAPPSFSSIIGGSQFDQ